MPKMTSRTIVAAFIFLLAGLLAIYTVPSVEIAVVTSILLLIVFLFAFEVVGVDVAAVSILVLLGLISSFQRQTGFGTAPGTSF